MPVVPFIPLIIGAATTVGTTVYANKQNNAQAARASASNLEMARLQKEAADRAFELGKGQLHYDRWKTAADSAARQKYLDLAMNMSGGGGGTYDPGPYTPADPFVAPTREAAMSEPGYALAAEEGNRAMETSPAANSGLLGGGTLQDLQGWGGQRATGQYDKVYGRARNAYAMKEALRGDAWDRTVGAGFNAASLRNHGASASLGNMLNIAQLAGAGEYPGYVSTDFNQLNAGAGSASLGQRNIDLSLYRPPGYRVS